MVLKARFCLASVVSEYFYSSRACNPSGKDYVAFRFGEKMSARLDSHTFGCRQCPFFTGGREQGCLAVEGSMRCSLFEIEHFCTNDDHMICPVYQERMRTQECVSLERYEIKLQDMEFHQVA